MKNNNDSLNLKKKKKIFISCGEMSGDLHASYIVEEMRKKDENIEFFYFFCWNISFDFGTDYQ